MNELATAQTFVLGSALIVAALLVLEWVETGRTRVSATHRRASLRQIDGRHQVRSPGHHKGVGEG